LSVIAARGVATLPRDLNLAMDALEADEVICNALGPTLTEQFVKLKRAEWIEYSHHVSGWELERYAAAF
jgi:glutamine synthetase